MAKRAKKIKIIMCGSCYEDFQETEITIADLLVNTGNPKNGHYQRNLCSKCLEMPWYKEKMKK